MLKKIDKKFILLTFVFLVWVSMWISINALPYEIKDMTKSFVQFLNGLRSIGAILFSLISLILLFFLIIFKKINKISLILVLFSLYFIFQFIGLITNETRIIELNTIYLVLYSLGTISILIIIDSQKLDKILPHFFYFALTILTIAYLIILSRSTNDFLSIHGVNLYYLISSNETIFHQATPKISGLTRAFAIISLSLLVIFTYNKKIKVLSPIIFSLVIFLSMFIWIAQSRGTIICYYTTSIFFIIFLNDLNKFKKFLIIVSITTISIIASNEIIKFTKKNIYKDAGNFELRVLKKETISSGRITLWKGALERYEKKKIFGYGPQADRLLLKDYNKKYGNNVSNTMIYAFLSGGYFSLLSIILIYVYTAYMILKYFLINKIFYNKFKVNRENIFVVASIVYSVFFMIRSLFENSFGVFSIDFLIVVLSLFVIEKSKLKRNIQT